MPVQTTQRVMANYTCFASAVTQSRQVGWHQATSLPTQGRANLASAGETRLTMYFTLEWFLLILNEWRFWRFWCCVWQSAAPDAAQRTVEGRWTYSSRRVTIIFLESLTRCTENQAEAAAPPADALTLAPDVADHPISLEPTF